MIYERAVEEVLKLAGRLAGKAEAEVKTLCEPEIHALLVRLGYVRPDLAAEPTPAVAPQPATAIELGAEFEPDEDEG